eukprot:1358273-Alexandrium_andersonii.AAC.1
MPRLTGSKGGNAGVWDCAAPGYGSRRSQKWDFWEATHPGATLPELCAAWGKFDSEAPPDGFRGIEPRSRPPLLL